MNSGEDRSYKQKQGGFQNAENIKRRWMMEVRGRRIFRDAHKIITFSIIRWFFKPLDYRSGGGIGYGKRSMDKG